MLVAIVKVCVCAKGKRDEGESKNLIQEGKRDGETGRVRVETSDDRGVFCGLGGV
jgi:hypothetical protein